MYFIVTVVRFVIILIKFYVCMYMYVLQRSCSGTAVKAWNFHPMNLGMIPAGTYMSRW